MLGSDFKISYAPKEQVRISKLANQLYLEDLNNIKGIEDNSVSFKTLYIYQLGDNIEVKAFILNSTEKSINFDTIELCMVNENNEIVAAQRISLVDVGEIPPGNARPHSIFFNKNNVVPGKVINDNCRLVMQLGNTKAKMSCKAFANYIDDKIPLYEKRIIESYIENMPAAMKNQLKLIPYKSGTDEDGSRYLILIAVNSYDRNARLENINISYKDIVGLLQARKKVESLPGIKANSVSVFRINLEQKDIIKEPFYPERCKIIIA